jgi:Ser/Thr protein kinase RdoA (MazF antagonist)
VDTWELVGGDVTVVDGLVLRPARPWTTTVHALLRHVRGQGLGCVPEPVGVRDGIEGLRRLDGDAGPACWRHQLTEDAVRSAGALLRRIHDATEGFQAQQDAEWAFPAVPGAVLVTHGDPGPWNFVWRGGEAVGLIDWDYAAPAPAIDDVAYAVEMFAPFRSDEVAREVHGFTTPPDRNARVRAFAAGYELGGTDGLVDRVIERQEATLRRIADLAGRGHEPWASWVLAGYLDEVKSRPRWTRQHRHLVE